MPRRPNLETRSCAPTLNWTPRRQPSVYGPFPRPEESYHLPLLPPPDEEKEDKDKPRRRLPKDAKGKKEPRKTAKPLPPKPVVKPCRAYEELKQSAGDGFQGQG